ncbi:uncharacterized protein PG998_007196 [Apiospora kogelbergensis]|uniref:uncharacterized protein n=1 Tax=Apiospora kogelbergensis TaxID=1337665 RepID=UPI0031327A10
MLGFFHWFSSFNQLQLFGWSFSEFCQVIKLWTQHQAPVIVDVAGPTVPESEHELCAAEYRKFAELVSPTHNSKIMFLAIDAITQPHIDGAISQLALSTWIPRHNETTVCSQWQIEGSPGQMLQIQDLATSDDIHVDEKSIIFESDISELLRRELESASREYNVVVVLYDMGKALSRLGDKLNLQENVTLLDARKIWRHKRHDLEDMGLDGCLDELPHCHHLINQPSAGNNAYHITQILAIVMDRIYPGGKAIKYDAIA